MTPSTKDDRRGVFVPLWAMEDCGGDARDAMVLAQITWWLQPAQRDGRSRTGRLVTRDDEVWLAMTDAELADDLGMTRDQVLRARRSLVKRGTIACKVTQVEYRKITLTRPVERAESQNGEREVDEPMARDDVDAAAESHNAPSTEIEKTKTRDTASSSDAASLVVEELCSYLADRIEQHRGGDRPGVTGRWRTAMRLLVERGPLHLDAPSPQPADKVRVSIDAIFDELATPGRDGFCWADQVRSPTALRDHWTQLREAYKRQTGSRVGRGAQAVDRVATRLAREGAQSRQPLGLLGEHEPKEITA